MVTQSFVSTVVMGLLVAIVMFALSRMVIAPARSESESMEPYERAKGRFSAADDPAVMGLGFVLLALLSGLVVVASVGGFGLSQGIATSLYGVALGVIGLLLAGFLAVGLYVFTREHGLGNAQGVAAGITGLGFAFIGLVVANLAFGLF